MWYVRHSPAKDSGICAGQFPIEVTDSTKTACERILINAPVVPSNIYSSDLPRCADLAVALSKTWGIPLHINERLREISMGQWEGKSYSEIESTDSEAWHHWCKHWQTEQPPGGETLEIFAQRVQEWFISYQKTQLSPSSTLLIAHAGVIRALHEGLTMKWEQAMQIKVPHLTWQKLHMPSLENKFTRS